MQYTNEQLKNAIKFWKTNGLYGFLSNFYYSSITIGGVTYLTVEHYFQSKKFEGTKWELYIIEQKTPHLAAKEGRRRDLPLRKDWEQVKEEIMMKGLMAKFTQHPDLKRKLLETWPKIIIEDSPVDDYWGIGEDGRGKNRLGVCLMYTREIMKQHLIVPKQIYTVC